MNTKGETPVKKMLFFTLTLILLVGLVPAVSAPSRPAQAKETIEITFVHIFPDERDVRRATIEQIAADFMALHPDVKINIQTTTDSYGDVFDNALLAASQGSAPDVVQVEDTLTQIAIDLQYFVKLKRLRHARRHGDYPRHSPAVPQLLRAG